MNKQLKAILVTVLGGLALMVTLVVIAELLIATDIVMPDIVVLAVFALAIGMTIITVVGWFLRMGRMIEDLHKRSKP